MGVIYEGVQLPMKRPIAIKVIRDELLRDDMFTERFLREAKLLDAASSHPNIVDVFDFGETETAASTSSWSCCAASRST